MFNQLYITAIAIVAILAALSSAYYFLHVKPIKELEDKNAEQKATMVVYEKTINQAYSKVYTLEQNLTTQQNQGYIDGKSEENATVSTGSLDNLFSK